MNKKNLIILLGLVALFLGGRFFYYNAMGIKALFFSLDEKTLIVCDESGKIFFNKQAALESGLVEREFNEIYCKNFQENEMNNIDTDGIKFYWSGEDLCDENGKRYKNWDETKDSGLKDSEFGATYCPEYKMDSSWDIDKDGINDCYNDGSCESGIDYMSPKQNKIKISNSDEKTMIIKIPSYDLLGDNVSFTEYEVPYSTAVLNSVYKKLFEVNSGERGYNGLKYESVSIKDKVVVLNLSGSWYPVGDMSGGYMRNNVNGSAFQFDSVNRIKVYLNGELFDWCVDSEAEFEESHCDTIPQYWDNRK